MTEFVLPPVPYVLDSDIGLLTCDQLKRLAGEHERRPSFHLESNAIRRYQTQASVEGHRFLSDEERKAGGNGTAPAPLRYFVAGVLMCIEVWIVKLSGLGDVPLCGLHTEADAFLEHSSGELSGELSHGRGFEQIAIKLLIETNWGSDHDEAIRQLVAQAMLACPAAVTASRGTDLEVTIVHNGVELTQPE